jgi:hypothetical protein
MLSDDDRCPACDGPLGLAEIDAADEERDGGGERA